MANPGLIMLLDDVRAKLLRRLEGVSREESLWTPHGLHNNIVWNAGHAYVVVEHLGMRTLMGQIQVPSGWFENFSWESRPDPSQYPTWPDLSAVVEQLKAQQARLRGMVEAMNPADLDQTNPSHPDRSRSYWLMHALHDEACHSGEVWLLRKLYKSRPH